MSREIIRLNLNENVLPKLEHEIARPVIEHLIERRNQRPPFNDGRKISAYFVGGFFTTARGLGVAAGLQQAGLGSSFDRVYGSSAGFFIASYFLTPDGPKKALEFARTEKISRNPLKLTDPEYYLKLLYKAGCLNPEVIEQHPTELYSRLKNIDSKESVFVRANGISQADYLTKLEAAVSLPLLKPRGVKVGEDRLRDPLSRKEYLLNSMRDLLDSDATDIALVLSQDAQLQYLKENLPEIFSNHRVLILPLDLSAKLKRLALGQQASQDLQAEAYKCQRETEEIFK